MERKPAQRQRKQALTKLRSFLTKFDADKSRPRKDVIPQKLQASSSMSRYTVQSKNLPAPPPTAKKVVELKNLTKLLRDASPISKEIESGRVSLSKSKKRSSCSSASSVKIVQESMSKNSSYRVHPNTPVGPKGQNFIKTGVGLRVGNMSRGNSKSSYSDRLSRTSEMLIPRPDVNKFGNEDLKLALKMKTAEANNLSATLAELKKTNHQIEMDNLQLRQSIDELNFELNQSEQKCAYYKSLSELKNDEIIHMSNKVNSLKKRLKYGDGKRRDNYGSDSKSGIGIIEELSEEGEGSETDVGSKLKSDGYAGSDERKVSMLKRELTDIFNNNKEFSDTLLEHLFQKIGLAPNSSMDKSSLLDMDNTMRNNESIHSSPSHLLQGDQGPIDKNKVRLSMKHELGLTDRIWLNTLNFVKDKTSPRIKLQNDSVPTADGETYGQRIYEFVRLMMQVLKGRYLENDALKASHQLDQNKLKRAKAKLEEYRQRILVSEERNRKARHASQPQYQAERDMQQQHTSVASYPSAQMLPAEVENEENSIIDNYVDDFDLQGYNVNASDYNNNIYTGKS